MTEVEMLSTMRDYFEEEIVQKHQDNLLTKHSRLSNYQINPLLVKYLSRLKEGGVTDEGIAKALFYPRALGTSITGSFGTKFQKMLIELGLVSSSLIQGMDIEFMDKVDNRHKYCQLKSGPNTINSGDVNPILREFDTVTNLARTNSFPNFNNNDLILGIMYGDSDQLSGHYRRIDQRYPVYIGAEFWQRVTGFPNFYSGLVREFDQLIDEMSTGNVFQTAYNQLLAEIRDADLI